MVLAVTCALWLAIPGALPAPQAPSLDPDLSLGRSGASGAPVPLAVSRLPDQDLGEGTGDRDHQDHMGPMWIAMGAMMAVMMVGMGVYFMRHGVTGRVQAGAAAPSPAQVALPVASGRGGS